jgi:hypothetical protein
MVRETARTLKRNTTDIVIMPYSSGYHAKQTAKAREIVGPMNKADVGLTTIPMYYIYDGDWHKSIKTVIENACLRMIEAGDRSRALIYVPDGARGMAMDIIRDSEHFALLERFSFITEEGLAENALIDVGQHIMIGKSFLNYERNVEIGNDVTKETACLLGYLKSIAAIPPDSGPEAINDLLRGLRLLRIAPINIDQIDDRARAYRIALESA